MTFEEWWSQYRGPTPDDETVRETIERVSAKSNGKRGWTAATVEAATVAKQCCEVYGAEFAEMVYKKVTEGVSDATQG